MEIEFNGITAKELQNLCDNQGISAEIFPLSTRDPICPRQAGREFGDGETYYLVEESCWHGYYFCGDVRCGRASTRYTGVRPSSVQKVTKIGPRGKTSRRSSVCDCSGADCNFSDSDCDSGSDSAGALILFFIIIAAILILIILLPYFIPIVALGIELGLALLLGVFDIFTFGIFRKRFKRVLIYIPKSLSELQLNEFIRNAASMGGLPRHTSKDLVDFLPKYGTNGFWILRTGAYLFLPSLIATILVIWLQPESNLLFYIPIVSFLVSIIVIFLGNIMISKKANQVASMT